MSSTIFEAKKREVLTKCYQNISHCKATDLIQPLWILNALPVNKEPSYSFGLAEVKQ